jgi:Zn-dependent protease with chaperone function
MLWEAVSSFFGNPLHLTVLIVSWALALITFLFWQERGSVRWLYSHLFFLFVPLLDFAVAVPCQIPFVQGLLSFCSVVVTRAVIFAVPFALLFAVVLGYHAVPALYKRMYRAKEVRNARFERLAGNSGLKGTRLFVLDTAKPIAFSFRKDVFMSVGMFELLKSKEQDAVLLHELGHVKQKSSLAKFSLSLARWFSPVAHFASVGSRVNSEEKAADRFAVRMQGTARHLKAAKSILNNFI